MKCYDCKEEIMSMFHKCKPFRKVDWNTYRSSTKAQRCPVCMGKGELIENSTYTATNKKQCHGCNGKGWVTV